MKCFCTFYGLCAHQGIAVPYRSIPCGIFRYLFISSDNNYYCLFRHSTCTVPFMGLYLIFRYTPSMEYGVSVYHHRAPNAPVHGVMKEAFCCRFDRFSNILFPAQKKAVALVADDNHDVAFLGLCAWVVLMMSG